ncbi:MULTISPECIES: 2OG-Fe(II) oxygenase family protein [Pseudomonas]|uniref:2OG-Fe(II) oxygenase family protein n=1 Tax=Pseudomonas TaxID=286 RepID=UPI001BE8DE24|nr:MULTISPECIES: 2OG-Fe(II) oxygenase family protein [Pseudomonas]MBT2339003.1 2OG-Fe(II) oxygenase [Pseudomonas fluorescens]MCD4527789.1 2OG-Fe(II) oxygenase [Pseudomonas sp. C3-2018]
MLELSRLESTALKSHPFSWAEIGNLYSTRDAAALAGSFPHDHFKTVSGYGGEKNYDYEARALVEMGTGTIAFAEELSDAWLSLARDLGSAHYREAMSRLTGIDLRDVPMEVNVFHYGPGASLGAHPDLPDKLVTHILYFNESWNRDDGGCLQILSSNDPAAVIAEIEPLVGNSAVLVRSANSWHAVSQVVGHCNASRRSLTATFYRPGSVSSMWPPGDTAALHGYPRA